MVGRLSAGSLLMSPVESFIWTKIFGVDHYMTGVTALAFKLRRNTSYGVSQYMAGLYKSYKLSSCTPEIEDNKALHNRWDLSILKRTLDNNTPVGH